MLIKAIVQELRTKLALTTTTEINFSRVAINKAANNDDIILVVGSSNAKRLGAALQDCGMRVGMVISPNWRAIRGAVDRLAASVSEAITLYNPGMVIFYLLDNSVYYARWEDGSTIPARRGHDGQFHVDGDLVVATKQTQEKVFEMVGELLSLVKGRKRVVVLPLPRYITAGCCDDDDHIPNRRSASFSSKIREELGDLRRHFRDYLFLAGMRDTMVVDPNISVRSLAATEVWGDDPVHPKATVYAKIASDLLSMRSEAGFKRGADGAAKRDTERPPTGPGAPQSPQQPVRTRTVRGRDGSGQDYSSYHGRGRGRAHWTPGNRGHRHDSAHYSGRGMGPPRRTRGGWRPRRGH